MSTAPPPKKKSGLSLYAEYLTKPDSSSGAVISGAPVKYEASKRVDGDAPSPPPQQQKKKDASLHFQPILRPQKNGNSKNANKPKPSSSLHKLSSSTATTSTGGIASSSPVKRSLPAVQRTNFADWLANDDEEDFYYQDTRPKHERGGRKKNKNNKKPKLQIAGQGQSRIWNWDDVYDPTFPNCHADYKGSEEQARAARDWKNRLYCKQMRKAEKETLRAAAEDGAAEGGMIGKRAHDTTGGVAPPSGLGFAPPSGLNFAPPSDLNSVPPLRIDDGNNDDDDDFYPPVQPPRNRMRDDAPSPPPSFAPTSMLGVATGEDAYKRRMQFTAESRPTSNDRRTAPSLPVSVTPPHAVPVPTAPPSTPLTIKAAADIAAKKAEALAKIAAVKARIAAQRGNAASTPPPLAPIAASSQPDPLTALLVPSITPAPMVPPVSDAHHAPPPPPSAPPSDPPGVIISRAPILYAKGRPTSTPSLDATTAAPRSSSSIPANPARDQQPRSDNRPGQSGFAERLLKKYGWEKGRGLGVEGGEGISTPLVVQKRKQVGIAKIVGGKRRKVEGQDGSLAEAGEGGPAGLQADMSLVIKLTNMLTGLDVEHEIVEANLYEEIGREMEKSYGPVERVFVWRKEMGGGDEVFVKFGSALSALNAVKACDGEGWEFAGNLVGGAFWSEEKFEEGVYA